MSAKFAPSLASLSQLAKRRLAFLLNFLLHLLSKVAGEMFADPGLDIIWMTSIDIGSALHNALLPNVDFL